MGDRLLMQCHNDVGDFGPVVYCHWSGPEAPEIVRAFARVMATRPDDVEYATARLLQAAIKSDTGNTGFGVMNATKLLDAGDSHEDAGVVLIDVSNGFRCRCLGGYLRDGSDGFPSAKEQ